MTEAVEPHVLIVDDARDIREPLALFLRRNGLRVSTAEDAVAARRLMAVAAINLVVLDVMMPGESGLSLCRAIATGPAIPVIMLSARVAEEDQVGALEIGADDYVTKPFNPRELLARIRAVLRRVPARMPSAGLRRRRFAGLVHDPVAQNVQLDTGETVALTSGENRLLGVFLDHPGEVLSRDRLLDLLQGRQARAYDRAVDNTVSRLRRKIGDDNRATRLIGTEWGGGYRLVAVVEEVIEDVAADLRGTDG